MRKLFGIVFLAISLNGFTQNLIPAEKKGKWGYQKEGSKKFAIKPAFEAVMPFGKMLSEGKAFVKQAGQWGIIDTKGKWLVKPTYDTLFQLKKAQILWLLAKTGKEKFILNANGEKLTPAFSDFEPYNQKIILVTKDKKWGLWQYDNGSITEILPIEHEKVGIADNELNVFYAYKNQKVRFYNVLTKKFSEEYDKHRMLRTALKEDSTLKRIVYQVVERNGKKGLFNPNDFKLILPISFDDIRLAPEGQNKILFEVLQSGLFGIFDNEGKEILPIVFERFSYLYKDFVLAMKKQQWGAYNYEGKQILSHLYQDIRYWKDANVFAVVKDSLHGIVSYEEKIILPPNYQAVDIMSFAKPFYIRLTQKNKQKIVILEGDKIVPYLKEEYEKIQNFNEKYWYAQNLLKKMLIDKATQKTWLIPPHTRIEDGKRLYLAVVDSQRVMKPYAENQPEGTFYLENQDKAFFWRPTENKLIPTTKIKEWKREAEQEDKMPQNNAIPQQNDRPKRPVRRGR
ncbi:MAG: WG repeat-containing protein [Raineya sp.]|nr:WG repeat-containing protein [Raineya sp.]